MEKRDGQTDIPGKKITGKMPIPLSAWESKRNPDHCRIIILVITTNIS
jgi:hypothetical protein